MNQALLLSIASSYVFRKLPVDVAQHVLSAHQVLETMNEYTLRTYGDSFWSGSMSPEAFNKDYRLVCPPTSFDLIPTWPFFVKTIFLERTPFIEGKDYAKFAIHKSFKDPLLAVKG
jgi:hypothetical protein